MKNVIPFLLKNDKIGLKKRLKAHVSAVTVMLLGYEPAGNTPRHEEKNAS